MKLHEITDEHIKSLASFNGISSEDVEDIRRKEGDWCILYWNRTHHNSGRVFVSDEQVYFSDNDGKEFASFLEIQFLLDLGYEIFTKKGE